MADVFHRRVPQPAFALDDSPSGRVAGWESAYGLGTPLIPSSPLAAAPHSLGGTLLIQGGTTSAEEIAEVTSLLAQPRFDRDALTGVRAYSNNNVAAAVPASADEVLAFDRGDSLVNAIDIGRIVYRGDAAVSGHVGAAAEGLADRDDYYRFELGKAGSVSLSLTELTQDAGLELYSGSGALLFAMDRPGVVSESFQVNLAVGSYVTRVYGDLGSGLLSGGTAYALSVIRQADGLEASWRNLLVDEGLENAALNAIQTENTLSREDVVGILKSAADLGGVTAVELADLRTFYTRAINTSVAAQTTKILAAKVLFADASNTWYTGFDSLRDGLGNLVAGSSATQLQLLIGKHFLGTDRPAIHRDASGLLVGAYALAGGSLFVAGASADDVRQGTASNCYFLAPLAGTARDKPSLISSLFTDNGDGSWSVKFYTKGKLDCVTVDRMMPADASGAYIYANSGLLVSAVNELWVALLEKAYAQVNESGRIGQDGTNFYGNGNDNGIGWGVGEQALAHITGLRTGLHPLSALSGASLIVMVNSSRVVTIGTFNALATETTTDPALVSSAVRAHLYTITAYDPFTARFAIRNPWGNRHLSLTDAQLRSLGGWISATTT